MEIPPIRYARTADDVNIAYWTLGSGPVLLEDASHTSPSHLSAEWLIPTSASWYLALSRRWQVIRYDGRGGGMSDRKSVHSSVQNVAQDIETVLDAVGVDRVTILTGWVQATGAVRFALNQPGRVERLILWSPLLRGEDLYTESRMSVVPELASADLELYLESAISTVVGSWAPDARLLADTYRLAFGSREDLERGRADLRSMDVAGEVSELAVPTTIVHREDSRGVTLAMATRAASQIPRAELRVLSGSSILPAFGNQQEALDLIDAVGRRDRLPEGKHRAAEPPAFRTLLFTDLEGHTAMMSRLGDAKGREVLREHERITREALGAHGGQEVKTMGDGFMASFGSAQRALDCAVALQRAVAGGIGGEALRIRAGINAGEPIAEDDDLFGSSVIAAARIAGKASGGQVLVSDVVRQLVAGKGFLFSDTGLHDLKGLEEPVRLWELRWEGA